mmetsp:Transcript_2263/g.4865  ORF Transcript_2263/g.4865 Transcript_2263/m.4865 type:complete len:116 (+) Transcript_2263:47-394(+)
MLFALLQMKVATLSIRSLFLRFCTAYCNTYLISPKQHKGLLRTTTSWTSPFLYFLCTSKDVQTIFHPISYSTLTARMGYHIFRKSNFFTPHLAKLFFSLIFVLPIVTHDRFLQAT